jgi:hypothetical protein
LAAPYTFFLPHESELAALRIGDLVKMAFEWELPVAEYEAERMWVTIMQVGSPLLMGTLENEPFEKGRMKVGDAVSFQRHNILAVQFADPPPDVQIPEYREYWERCLVDDCVLYEGEPVEFLYREEPHMTEDGDTFPDSGWRIRGIQGDATDEEMANRKHSYVALGAVLNKDDSWLALIDTPVGSEFMRDFTTGRYVEQTPIR